MSNLERNLDKASARIIEFGEWIIKEKLGSEFYFIDKGIRPLVVVLLLLGIKTEASCEGHLDHGHPYP